MTVQELRDKFLDFFRSKGHTIIPSASLIPKETDPSVLFTTAGMHPLVPYLLGEEHPGGKRVANVQKCIRTGDIDEVGDASHLTFFEMLGNWSFGDYFKKEAIEWSWEFLTSSEWLGLDKDRFAISVFAGDEDAPFDVEAFDLWKNIGIPEKRIAKLPKKNNWWGPAGQIGPCGPDTEIFYWTGDPDKVPDSFNDDNDLWVEVWNNVFMQYNKTAEGKFLPLKQKNVDTGMGLERLVMIMEGKNNVYETDLFAPVIEKIKSVIPTEAEGSKKLDSSTKLEMTNINTKSYRIIADHIKASVFIIVDGVTPLNIGSGYVLRRLIRRAIRHGHILGIENNFTKDIAEVIVEIYKNQYPELEKNKNKIFEELEKEENKFRETLEKGLKEFNNLFARRVSESGEVIDINVAHAERLEKIAFNLFQTYGFPLEMTIEEAIRLNIPINEKKITTGFGEELKKHQDLSRTASAGMFKGGLAEASEITMKYHTATHLLLAALREILGPETYQKGSNINAERLRFDFNYPQKLAPEQLKRVEDLVNQKIQEKIPVEMEEMPKDEALKTVKVSFDPEKYGDIVKVYKISNFSVELCGGPHVKNTGELGRFKITKEEASSSGVRRIKAVLE